MNIDRKTDAKRGERIRMVRTKVLGIRSQEKFAEIIGGVTRGAVGNWEIGKEISLDNLKAIATKANISLDWLINGEGSPKLELVENNPPSVTSKPPQERHQSNAVIGEPINGSSVRIPVYGQAVGGIDGEFIMNGSILYEVLAPPQIAKISGAYGVLISGDSMYPRYEDGEIAFIDPTRRVKKGDYVVAQIQMDEHSAPHAFVKRFLRHNAEELVLSQFNPPKDLVFDHDSVVSVHFIALAGVA